MPAPPRESAFVRSGGLGDVPRIHGTRRILSGHIPATVAALGVAHSGRMDECALFRGRVSRWYSRRLRLLRLFIGRSISARLPPESTRAQVAAAAGTPGG